ncbi:oxidoreductase [Prolixibacter denitrificans]|uniref:Nucleoside-diphosphate sugar epimerase n=1 Tax=Prolixibacter denitrificans TaxID=1541063 RepID=A0A2P8C6H8_9BACT|nr:oxidoreductase [Prolixibacter denitrificans]PSK80578.1 uncharacterized protein YbjT (DUF2867 family) [Prolixibacter denitrificans]GET22127.1 nucleoside-diphosphate sugar epimerase [Prolixibacter denitrificans]
MRTAVIAGASGLVGKELVYYLSGSPEYSRIHLLVRRQMENPGDKIIEHLIDFDQLVDFSLEERIDDVYCALGTTMKKAGSKDAFRRVDLEYVVTLAKRAKELGAHRFLVVSSMGADPKSMFFYNRIKGKMEKAIRKVGMETTIIVRPSLLLGDRKEKRFSEEFSAVLMKILRPLIPKKYRAVSAGKVAGSMYHMALTASPGLHILESNEIQDME